MDRKMTLGSLFSGSGGFELGGLLSGIEPLWASEVEPFPIRVTTKRLPQVKHLGDINKINGATVPPVDIITGGFCCQDLSVAGKRAGLHGERSGLFFQIIRIIKEMQEATNNEFPKFVVLENVPGLLSSNKGQDFFEVLDELAAIGFLADPNIVDSQDFGVAQRRKRVYVTCINVNHLMTQKTHLSASITLQLIIELLQTSLAGLSVALGIEPKSWALNEKGLSVDGLAWRMNIFSLTSEKSLAMLQSILDDVKTKCQIASENLDLRVGNAQTASRLLTVEDMKLQHSEASKRRSMSTGLSLKKCLDDALEAVNESIISTVISETTTKQIFSCVRTLQNISELTIRYAELLAKTESVVLNCLEWVNCFLKNQRGYIKNARQKNREGANSLEWDDLLWDYEQTISTAEKQFKQCFTSERAGKILFDESRLRGDFAKGNFPWQGVAGGASSGAGNADYQGAIAFEPGACSRLGGHCWNEHVGALRAHAGDNQAAVIFPIENHPADGRVKINKEGIVQTLDARMGMGGGNVPLVMNTVKAYGISSYESNAMRSPNPHSGIYKAETSRTIDSGGGRPDCNQGGIAICVQGSMIGRTDKNGPQGDGINTDVSFTLNTCDKHSVAYAMTTGEFTQVCEEQAPCLQARDYKDPPVVSQSEYVVRRLTPTECALLQGFPPDWCGNLETPAPTEDDIDFWAEVFETHRKIMGKSTKPKSRNQIIKWLQNPHSDSAQYKMWGNGVALPCVVFVLGGIVWASKN